MPALFSLGTLLGRLAIVSVFATAVPRLIEGFSRYSGLVDATGLPLADVITAIGIGFAGAGSLLLVVGWWSRLGAILLMIFLFVATLLAHNIFDVEMMANLNEMQQMQQQIHFGKNAAIMGGLLMIFAVGPGPISLGARKHRLVIQ